MAQVFVFMVAGFDNSGYVAAITNYMLSKHPEIQARVREEIKMAKDKYGGINYQSLREMKLLGACIDGMNIKICNSCSLCSEVNHKNISNYLWEKI